MSYKYSLDEVAFPWGVKIDVARTYKMLVLWKILKPFKMI